MTKMRWEEGEARFAKGLLYHVLPRRPRRLPRRDGGYLDPDSSHLAKSFQKRVQKLSGLSKAPLFRKELECFKVSIPAFFYADPTLCLNFLGLHSKSL